MKEIKSMSIEVQGTPVSVLFGKDGDYISLTEFLGIWESVFNPNFNYGEFAIIKSQVGLNRYKISVKEWVEKTNAIGLKATAGR